MLKQRKLKHPDSGPSQQMSLAADSLSALKHSMPPRSSVDALNVDLLSPEPKASVSPGKSSLNQSGLYGALRSLNTSLDYPVWRLPLPML
jgi:hypothetical protein